MMAADDLADALDPHVGHQWDMVTLDGVADVLRMPPTRLARDRLVKSLMRLETKAVKPPVQFMT